MLYILTWASDGSPDLLWQWQTLKPSLRSRSSTFCTTL